MSLIGIKHNPAPWQYEDVPLRAERSAYGVVKDKDGKILFDSLNSDVAEIHEEGDEDGYSRWDETGRRNLTLAAAAPALLANLMFAVHLFENPDGANPTPTRSRT